MKPQYVYYYPDNETIATFDGLFLKLEHEEWMMKAHTLFSYPESAPPFDLQLEKQGWILIGEL